MSQRLRNRSESMQAQARALTPGGVHSNVRMIGPLVFFERGQGAWLWDVDGNDYVDYLLGQGPNFLGHAPEAVTAAVAEAARRGTLYGAQHVLEIEAGELFLESVAWADQVRFGVSGTEAVQAALRLARAATGRRCFVRFEGHYHGWLDNVLISTTDGKTGVASAGQLAHHLHDSYVLPWNDAAALEALLAEHGQDIAAVILEPFMCNNGAIAPKPDYLGRVRELCDRHGVVLIFDEVITGFRLARGGAAERFGVAPDLATFGKAIAGGWPVAALAGRAELMELIGPGGVNHAGTFNASVPACAAVIATLKFLRDASPYAAVERHGAAVIEGIGELARRHDVPLRTQGLPAAFHVSFGDPEPVHDLRGLQRLDLARYQAFVDVLVAHGVWVAGRGIWYVSASHGDRELAVVLERVDSALTAATSISDRH